MPQAVTGFFGPGEGRALGLYASAALLLSLPWVLVWGSNQVGLRSIAGVLLGVVPPLGLIGWASPLIAAGWLFPGTTVYAGVPLLLLLVAALAEAARRERMRGVLERIVYVIVIVLNLACFLHRDRTSNNWEGVTLHTEGNPGPVAEYVKLQLMQDRAATSKADVLVFPEGAQENWSELTEFTWADTFSDLRARHHVVLLGATSLGAGTQYRNGFVIRGAETDLFQQRVPVPLAMWHPFSRSSGVPLRLFAPGTVRISGESVGVLMCYEMTIPWPALATLTEHPARLVGLANDWWAKDTPSFPRCQATALQGWARLAGIPSTLSMNLPKGVTL